MSKSRDPDFFHDTHVLEMMKKLHADKKSEANEPPIPSAGAAISPRSNLVRNKKKFKL